MPSILARLRTMPASCHQALDFLRRVARDLFRIEIVEGGAEIVALAQNRDPRQSGLKAVEDQLFEQRAVIPFRHAPFLVVIGDVKRIVLRPGAADKPVGMFDGRAHVAAFSPGQAKSAHVGFHDADFDAAGDQRRAGGHRIGDAVEPQQSQPLAIRGRAHDADRLVGGGNVNAADGRAAVIDSPAPRGCAPWL